MVKLPFVDKEIAEAIRLVCESGRRFKHAMGDDAGDTALTDLFEAVEKLDWLVYGAADSLG